ncbi:MAG: tryptophan synthase subunit alpha [Planctomycetota bacterium]|jgi:tryptophan synthase alpha chain
MNRINDIFQSLRGEGRKALMPFVTAGYPDLPTTRALLPRLQRSGAAICELGVPFSDPIADGPVIAASMTEALKEKVTPAGVFETVRAVRDELDMGLVAMVTYSIVYRMGVGRFVKEAADAGFDGFIFPDLPMEEAHAVSDAVSDAGLIASMLIAPTTPEDRAMELAKVSTGFIYLVARTGITGERAELPPELTPRIEKLKTVTDLPIAVGFGISNAEHVAAVTEVADAAIVGSALVKQITANLGESRDTLVENVGSFVDGLVGGLK